MKIAVQLFGHLRTFEQCSSQLKENLLDLYDCDVFIHTWDTLESLNKSDDTIMYTRDFIEKVNRVYQPKVLKIEKQNIFDDSNDGYIKDKNSLNNGVYNAPLSGLKYMYYSMFSSNILRSSYQNDKDIDYDYVFIIRPDIFLKDKISICKYQDEFDFCQDTLISFSNYPVLCVADTKMSVTFLANDVFILTNTCVADQVFAEFNDFDKYYINFLNKFPKKMIHPESSFGELVVGRKIIHRKYIFPFTIKRRDNKKDLNVFIDSEDNYFELSRVFSSDKRNMRIKKYKKFLFLFLFLFLFSFALNIKFFLF